LCVFRRPTWKGFQKQAARWSARLGEDVLPCRPGVGKGFAI
jgi:hypothetical protein